jgi:hypothetical protein
MPTKDSGLLCWSVRDKEKQFLQQWKQNGLTVIMDTRNNWNAASVRQDFLGVQGPTLYNFLRPLITNVLKKLKRLSLAMISSQT